MNNMYMLYVRGADDDPEQCYYIEVEGTLDMRQEQALRWLIGSQHDLSAVSDSSFLREAGILNVIEVGPRVSYQTPKSTNAVAICDRIGIDAVRIEQSRLILRVSTMNKDQIATLFDPMTEERYTEQLATFASDKVPEEVYEIPILEQGLPVFRKANAEHGWGMDEIELEYYTAMFSTRYGRNPTNVECYQLAQANSDHCRHKTFGAIWTIDGVEQEHTLMDLIHMPIQKCGEGVSLIAFHDNGSIMRGADVDLLIPEHPGKSSALCMRRATWHVGCTVETHNHPSLWEPFAGAATGDGGEIRDQQMTGCGSLPLYSIGGYAVGSLDIPGFPIPGESTGLPYPPGVALPLRILVRASDGYTRYANEFGLPAIQGFVRSGEIVLPNEERRGYVKPIVLAGGTIQIDDRHLTKQIPEDGLSIMQFGGPAYPIGIGGGAASSMDAGQSSATLDFASVQRGDPEMANKVNRVLRACILMGDDNPILNAHDQGAGGLSNVLTEIMGEAGGRIHIRRVTLGDTSMPVVYIWVAEFQERNAVLIHPSRVEEFKQICADEKVTCEVLGEITGDGKITVVDDRDGSTPVDMKLEDLFASFPQKRMSSESPDFGLVPFKVPDESMATLLERVFRIPDVGSKRYLINKGDRSVGGLVVQQQACGPLGLPVADGAVSLQSHFGFTGEATGIGEQPWKLLMDPAAGARLAFGESLQNISSAVVTSRDEIRCSVNWMAALKHPGEGALVYRAARALKDLAISLGVLPDGGKDSMSMAVKCVDEWVKAPPTMLVTAYAAVPDVRKVVNPAIRWPGITSLILVDPSCGMTRLGGSMLAKSYGQLGNEVPDMDEPAAFAGAFDTIQRLISDGIILAMHDRSDGGLITTLSEMVMAGDCGAELSLSGCASAAEVLFNEELGWVLECRKHDESMVRQAFASLQHALQVQVLGETTRERALRIQYNGEYVLEEDTHQLLKWWEAVSDAVEHQQMDPAVADEQAQQHGIRPAKPHLTFTPECVTDGVVNEQRQHTVVVLREEGVNGDVEMGTFFHNAGFRVVDVRMTDLLNGTASLEGARGIVFPGGFSYADVFGAAKGWAAGILFNPTLKEMFDTFFARKDTFSLGVCNGYQLMTYLGWLVGTDMEPAKQPRLVQNASKRFDSRTVMVRVNSTPSILLKGMEGSVLPVQVAHGEGQHFFPDQTVLRNVICDGLVPVQYVEAESTSMATELYPDNPNGSPLGIAGMCSADGRHLGMMPHPERAFRPEQMEWVPENWRYLPVGPWQQMTLNAKRWCDENPTSR